MEGTDTVAAADVQHRSIVRVLVVVVCTVVVMERALGVAVDSVYV